MTKKDNSTEATEELSFYESILPSCCCTGPTPDDDENSFVEEDKNRLKQQQQQRRRRKKKGNKYWDRLSDFALRLVGLAPPVKFIRCYDCVSVDDSELTLPAVLSETADEYDQITSIWSVSEDTKEELAKSDDFVHDPNTRQRRLPKSRDGGKSSDRIEFKNSSDSRSVFTEGPIYLQGA